MSGRDRAVLAQRFPTPTHFPFGPRGSNHLGVWLTPHKLRHAYGKNCIDLGADIRVISEALGHESLDSTRIYTQVPFDRIRALAALFDSPGGKIIAVDPAKKVRKMREG